MTNDANDIARTHGAEGLRKVWDATEATAGHHGNPDGASLLNDAHAFLGRFISYPCANSHVAHTLWIAHAHLMDAWESTPRIAFLSPEPASGKPA